MSNPNPLGFAIRRENLCSSSAGEVDCGPTWGDFRACCPSGAYCPSTRDPGYYNAECCDQPDRNCTQTILDEGPFCANTSWKMYDNYGYFCCDPKLDGFSNGIGVGCAKESTYSLASGQDWISTTAMQESKPTHSSSSPSSATSSSSKADSGLSGGAIAGIVIGCVAAVVLAFLAGFLLMRRTRRRKTSIASHSEKGEGEVPIGQSTNEKVAGDAAGSTVHSPAPAHDSAGYFPEKVHQSNEPVELPADPKPTEVPGSPVHPSTFQAEKPG